MRSQTQAPSAQFLSLSSAAQVGRAVCWERKLRLLPPLLLLVMLQVSQMSIQGLWLLSSFLAYISSPSVSTASLLVAQLIIVLCSEGAQSKRFAAPTTTWLHKHLNKKPACHSVACAAGVSLLRSVGQSKHHL